MSLKSFAGMAWLGASLAAGQPCTNAHEPRHVSGLSNDIHTRNCCMFRRLVLIAGDSGDDDDKAAAMTAMRFYESQCAFLMRALSA